MPHGSALRLVLLSSSSSSILLYGIFCAVDHVLWPLSGHLPPPPLFFHPHQEGNLKNRSSGCSSCIVPVEKAPLLWLPSSLPLLLPPSRHDSPGVCWHHYKWLAQNCSTSSHYHTGPLAHCAMHSSWEVPSELLPSLKVPGSSIIVCPTF